MPGEAPYLGQNRADMPLITYPIDIGENAWLVAETFVGPGVICGELCVGARSVAVKDLPPHLVCRGNACPPLKPPHAPRPA